MILNVKLYGKKIGKLVEQNNKIYFQYDKKFLSSEIEISPFKLPLSIGTKPYVNMDYPKYYDFLPGVFFDSLPDRFGTKIVEEFYKEKGIDKIELTTLQKLAFIGKNGIGALEYIPAVVNEEVSEIISIREIYEETKELIKEDSDSFFKNWLKHAQTYASAGGARPKALISWDRKNNIISTKDNPNPNFEEWLVKFDERVGGENENYFGYTQLEYLYMKMAKEIGINVPEIELINKDGLTHFAIKRFDRTNKEKFHTQTLASLIHLNFNLPNHYSYDNLIKMVDFFVDEDLAKEEIFKRMVFNVIGRNQDDHAKNFSFIMDKNGKWNLTPAYDITYAFGKGYTKNHQLSVNGKITNITFDDLIQVAVNIKIDIDFAKETIYLISNKFAKEFSDRAFKLNVNPKLIKIIEESLQIFNNENQNPKLNNDEISYEISEIGG